MSALEESKIAENPQDANPEWLNNNSFDELPIADLKELIRKMQAYQQELVVENKTLLESNEKWRFLLDNAPNIIVITDVNGTITYVNKTIPGLTVDDSKANSIFNFVNPNDHTLVRQCIDQVTKTGKSGFFESNNPDLPGSLWYMVHMGPIQEQDNITGLIFILTDVSEYKRVERDLVETEQRFRAIFDNAKDGILLTNIDTKKILTGNQAICEMLGYDLPELISRHITDLHPQKDKVNTLLLFNRQIQDQISSVRDVPVQRKDGSVIYADVYTFPISLARKVCLVYVYRDISDYKIMEEELFKTRRLESLGLLAGGIAHDYNNILTGILGNIDLAKVAAAYDNTTSGLLEAAEKAALEAKELTQQLLIFSGKGIVQKCSVAIKKLIIDSANFALSGSDVTCNFSIPDDLWHVYVDQGQIAQVMNNLILNAKQAMGDRGTIQVVAKNIILDQACPPVKKGEYVKISIKDQGIGISKENLVKIFDPFFSTKQKGTGLGLATAYSIIQNHNGAITVDSHPGIGTSIHIFLPVASKKCQEEKKETTSLPAGTGKILVMDDQKVVREVARKILTLKGYDVALAKDGEEAIQLFENARNAGDPFAAVIMDLTVRGGMGGEKAVQELLKIDPEVKVLVSSGYTNDPIMTDYKKYGFCGVVVKPFQIRELSEILHQVICNSE